MTISVPPELIASYRPPRGLYDEMVDPDGRVRPHWAQVGRVLDGLGLDELDRRRRHAEHLLDDDGVSYNVLDGTSDGAGPGSGPGVGTATSPRTGHGWGLDPVPVVISSDEWARIESGVIQRSELMNLILSDLYGPRDLLRRGLLPAQLVFGHPGFLRECDQVRIPGPAQLFTAAYDLARDGDGRCWVMTDHAQAPSGAGYALENRTVVSRVFPSLYREARVHRLAPFFRTLRTALQGVAPASATDPRIVVLTPGPWSETAFEHAYLASYLGYPLVEGGDLTVREGRLWLRSLGHLEQVDVVLRRVDSWFCDPLELRADSHLGVPGLVEATRLGTVSVVNTLGSGVLENAGLLAFLPRLSEALLGQPLSLPSVPTWWCGDPTSRSHVLANLSRLVIKPVARATGSSSIFGWQLDEAAREELAARIMVRPADWVGQDAVEIGCAPTLTPHGFEPRRTVLRAFAVASGSSYEAMPGGLTRVAPSIDAAPISNQAGALSKDTWVLASEPETLTGFWLQDGPAVIAIDPAGALSSRAAENLFWLGRYAERAEEVVRLLRTVEDRRNDFGRSGNEAGLACLQALFAALTHVTTAYPGFVGRGAAERLASPEAELRSLVADGGRPGTLAHALRRMLQSAQAVRDQLSLDTWMVVGNLDRVLLGLDDRGTDPQAEAQAALTHVLQALLALAGLMGESMVRDTGWRFLDAGRRIERALQLTSLLQATVTIDRGTATDSLLFESVLTAAESIITYRRRYRSQAQLETLLDLLLLDGDNPRSLLYQVDRLGEDLVVMPRPLDGPRLSGAERLTLEAATALRLADTTELARLDQYGGRPQLSAFLGRMGDLLGQVAKAVDHSHFTHLLPQRPLARSDGAALDGMSSQSQSQSQGWA